VLSALQNNYKEIATGVLVFNNNNLIDDLINDIEDLLSNSEDASWQPAKIAHVDGNYIVDKSIRDNLFFWLNKDLGFKLETVRKINFVEAKINQAVIPSLSEYQKIFNTNVKNKDPYELLKYNGGNGLGWHTDDGAANHSRISLLYYLNDNYEGGEIEFDKFNIKYKPVAGDILIFPSSFIYRHRVLPIINGTRYAVADFMA
jgi:hypothetical protein